MAQDPVVERVIAKLRRAVVDARAAEVAAAGPKNEAADAYETAEAARAAVQDDWTAWMAVKRPEAARYDFTAIDAAQEAEEAAGRVSDAAHVVLGRAEELTDLAEHNLRIAQNCWTLADLLTCDNSAVRLVAQTSLNPTPPARKRKR